MQVLYTVIDDIYEYTVGAVFQYIFGSSTKNNTPVIHLGPHTLPLLLDDVHEKEVITEPPVVDASDIDLEPAIPEELPPTFRPVSEVLETRGNTETMTNTIAFVSSARTPLFGGPTKEFDTVITTLSYGAMVMVLEEKGRFSRVAQDGITGWLLRDDLAPRAAYVYPEFIHGEENAHDDPNTLRLRACIKDEFYGGETEVALQAGEYVLYKLKRKGLEINWPPARPRTPGRWRTILRGVPGIHMGVTPKTGSVMECLLEHDMGHLAYVEAVFPDERITLSEANYPDRGIYNERTLTKEEWQALNPVFIQVM